MSLTAKDLTPEKKDTLLKEIFKPDHLLFDELVTLELDKEANFNAINAMLAQFERMGFLNSLNSRGAFRMFNFVPHLEGLDFLNWGGFTGQEKLLKVNIEKLLAELEQLKKTLSEEGKSKVGGTLKTITSIASDVLGFLSLLK